jgi:hypothetical protein
MSICPFDGGMLVSIPSEPTLQPLSKSLDYLGSTSVYFRCAHGWNQGWLRGCCGCAIRYFGLTKFSV